MMTKDDDKIGISDARSASNVEIGMIMSSKDGSAADGVEGSYGSISRGSVAFFLLDPRK